VIIDLPLSSLVPAKHSKTRELLMGDETKKNTRYATYLGLTAAWCDGTGAARQCTLGASIRSIVITTRKSWFSDREKEDFSYAQMRLPIVFTPSTKSIAPALLPEKFYISFDFKLRPRDAHSHERSGDSSAATISWTKAAGQRDFVLGERKKLDQDDYPAPVVRSREDMKKLLNKADRSFKEAFSTSIDSIVHAKNLMASGKGKYVRIDRVSPNYSADQISTILWKVWDSNVPSWRDNSILMAKDVYAGYYAETDENRIGDVSSLAQTERSL
jgi:hypothetical protein